MNSLLLRTPHSNDFPALLALNAESVHYLSPLDLDGLRRLHALSAYHRVLSEGSSVAAFLLALREGTDYASPNYRWFDARYPRFLYIDRVVVAATHQGQGLGARLYEDLFHFAREHGIDRIACEFDVEPPNEASRRFHARFGFAEVGSQGLGDGKKRVSLQLADSGATPG